MNAYHNMLLNTGKCFDEEKQQFIYAIESIWNHTNMIQVCQSHADENRLSTADLLMYALDYAFKQENDGLALSEDEIKQKLEALVASLGEGIVKEEIK